MASLVGYSVHSLQVEWPNFFNFVVAVALFLFIKLVVYVFQANRVPRPNQTSREPDAATPAPSGDAATTEAAGEDKKNI